MNGKLRLAQRYVELKDFSCADPRAQEEKDKIQQLEEETELTTELGLAIQTLWKDEGIQEIYRHKSWLQLIDSAS